MYNFQQTQSTYINFQTTYNFCTIAQTPRIPEHCIAYAQLIKWDEEFPDRRIDTDSVEDMTWLFNKASERADQFGIKGVTFKLTQGVVKVYLQLDNMGINFVYRILSQLLPQQTL